VKRGTRPALADRKRAEIRNADTLLLESHCVVAQKSALCALDIVKNPREVLGDYVAIATPVFLAANGSCFACESTLARRTDGKR
jgi:hypothetical protein